MSICRSRMAPSGPMRASQRARRSRRSIGAPSRRPGKPTHRREPSVEGEGQQPQQPSESAGASQPSGEGMGGPPVEEGPKGRIEDVILQSVVSILNLSARRIAKDDERDLEQAKIGIDAGRALVDLVKPDAQPQLRQAISELQVLYAKHAGEGPPSGEEEGGGGEPPAPEPPKGDSGLWTPG